jgi:DNA replication and repair protein RecF
MIVNKLQVSNFRNISSVNLEFCRGINIFYGDNGSGKTNLLEAIFTLCLGRSQRGAIDTVLIREGSDTYRLEGSVECKNRSSALAVAYQKGWRKKITVDSVVIRAAELYERFCAVACGPEDSEILSGSPGVRRLFLDIYLSQLSPRYMSYLVDYQKALAQKNAALKKDMDPSPFDPLLVAAGSQIVFARARFLRDLADASSRYYQTISGRETFSVAYLPKVSVESEDSIEEIAAELARELEMQRHKEAIVKTALVGPHRDDITFSVGGLPARTHGSQGQWRTAAVALKLAVYQLLKTKRESPPVLLLDEIFAELDASRSAQLMELFAGADQLFLTTASEPPPAIGVGGRRFRIVDGGVEGID